MFDGAYEYMWELLPQAQLLKGFISFGKRERGKVKHLAFRNVNSKYQSNSCLPVKFTKVKAGLELSSGGEYYEAKVER